MIKYSAASRTVSRRDGMDLIKVMSWFILTRYSNEMFGTNA